jgi:hypothetical protein
LTLGFVVSCFIAELKADRLFADWPTLRILVLSLAVPVAAELIACG